MRTLFLAAVAALALPFAARAQGLGGLLNQAKAKVGQASTAPAKALSPTTQGGDTGPLPESPSPAELTVDNNIEFAQTVLRNRRPYDPDRRFDADVSYRQLHYAYKVPLTFTWDRSYADYITPLGYYLWSVCENVSEVLKNKADPDLEGARYTRPKILKIKEFHFTTTAQPVSAEQKDRYAGAQNYLMSWNPATGVLTCALSTANGHHISNFRGEDIVNFINDKIK